MIRLLLAAIGLLWIGTQYHFGWGLGHETFVSGFVVGFTLWTIWDLWPWRTTR